MKKLIVFLLPILIISCADYGEKVVYNGTEVYFKDGATLEDAEKLGAYLEESEFADGNEKSVQLVKNGEGTWVFRMVVQEGAADGDETMFQLAAMGISMSVFDGDPVDVDLCDNTFTTIKTIPYAFSSDDSDSDDNMDTEVDENDSTSVE